MPKFLIKEGMYYSHTDETAFFRWLKSISGVTRVIGKPDGLEVHLRSRRLSSAALYELIALHFRYGLSMRTLTQFETPANRNWFRSREKYWYKSIFGNRGFEFFDRPASQARFQGNPSERIKVSTVVV